MRKHPSTHLPKHLSYILLLSLAGSGGAFLLQRQKSSLPIRLFASSPTETLFLPFPPQDFLLPGQSRQLLLKEGRFFDMIEEVTEERNSFLGMSAMGPDGLLSYAMLCKIDQYELEAGYRGKVTATITLQAQEPLRVVEWTALRPLMRGVCCSVKEESWTEKEAEEARDLVTFLEINLSSRQRVMYDEALAMAKGVIESTEDGASSLQASSWAIFAALGQPARAMECQGRLDRLQTGVRLLLNDQIQIGGLSESR